MKALVFTPLRYAALAAMLVVAACETPIAQYPEITFGHLAPIKLDVAEIEYVDSYDASQAPPNVAHLMPARPSVVARRWFDDRIVADGGGGRALVTLLEAKVVEVPLTIKTGLDGLFTVEQSERYDASVALLIEIFDLAGNRRGEARARAVRSRTVPEDITLNDRDQVWFEMTEVLMNDLDKALEAAIREHLAQWVKN